MNILYVSNLYGENARGGAERIVEAEARAMAASGHDVTVAHGVRAGEPLGSTHDGRLRVARYAPPNLYFYADDHKHRVFTRLLWHFVDVFNGPSARAFAEILESAQPDVVHTHNLMGLGFMIPAAIRRAARRRERSEPMRPLRHVHTVHDVQLVHPSGLLLQIKGGTGHEGFPFAKLMQAAYVRIMRSLMGSPDTVIFPSAFLLSFHDRLGFFANSRKTVVSNPAPAPSAVPRAVAPTPRFLFVGQIERHKGVYVLAEAWEKAGLHATHGATLEFVGAGTEEKPLKEKCAAIPGTSFSGKLTGDDLTAAYDRSTFLVVPSTVIENQPTVILEAFSRGTPAVAAVSGGIPELVRENKTGFLFEAGSAAACAAGLQRAVAATDWPSLSRAARAWAAAHDMSSHLKALADVYGS